MLRAPRLPRWAASRGLVAGAGEVLARAARPGRRVSTAFGAVNQIVHQALSREQGVIMGVAKKAKRDAKAVKGKTKKGVGKAKHKGKKVKKAAKH
jgi:ATP-dependent protease ClpP protease subunit